VEKLLYDLFPSHFGLQPLPSQAPVKVPVKVQSSRSQAPVKVGQSGSNQVKVGQTSSPTKFLFVCPYSLAMTLLYPRLRTQIPTKTTPEIKPNPSESK
jgi:hypothetical protein